MDFNLCQPFVTSVVCNKITCQSRYTLQAINKYLILKLVHSLHYENFQDSKGWRTIVTPVTMEGLFILSVG